MALNCSNIKLQKGSSDTSKVKELQTILSKLKLYTKSIDGDFGTFTDQAVREFQRRNKLDIDGIVGPQTCPVLNKYADDKKKEEDKKGKSKKKEEKINIKRDYGNKLTPELHLYPKFLTFIEETSTTTEDSSKVNQKDATTPSGDGNTITVNHKPSCWWCASHGNEGKPAAQRTWVNKCPHCGKTNLHDNPKNAWGGEVTCGDGHSPYNDGCDADYCGYCGREKIRGSNYQLTPVGSNTADIEQLDENSDTNATAKTKTVVTTKKTPYKPNKKVIDYYINDFTDFSQSADQEGLSTECTLTTPYTQEKYSNIYRYQECSVDLWKNKKSARIFYGYVDNINLKQNEGTLLIELQMKGFQTLLEQQIVYEGTAYRLDHIINICKKVGLDWWLQFIHLKNSEYTIKAEATSTATATATGGGTVTGDDAEKRKQIFAKAATWTYKSPDGDGSSSDPYTAYQHTERYRRCDCFGASASLYYQFKTFTNYDVRVVVGYSPYASSGTHRTIQLKENGQWVDPPEYHNMTRNLRVLTRYSRNTYDGYIWENGHGK